MGEFPKNKKGNCSGGNRASHLHLEELFLEMVEEQIAYVLSTIAKRKRLQMLSLE